MDLFVVLFATAMALYGFWYGAFAREFAARYPWTGQVKHRYKPSLWQRIMVIVVSLIIGTCAIAQLLRDWKLN